MSALNGSPHPAVMGSDIRSFLPWLLTTHDEIEGVTLLELHVPPSMETRAGASPALKSLAATARDRRRSGESFTETFMTLAAEMGATEEALDAAQFHQPLSRATAVHEFARGDVTAQTLESLVRFLPNEHILVFTSGVKTPEGVRHVPMVDFKLPSSERNNASASAAARRLGKGYLLTSGSSYHFYGADLKTADLLRDWLLRAQLLARYVDTRWVTHQLIERRCALRISPRNDVYPEFLGDTWV